MARTNNSWTCIFFLKLFTKISKNYLTTRDNGFFPQSMLTMITRHTVYAQEMGVLKVEKRSTKITLMWKIGRQIICPLIQVFQLDLEEEQVLSCQSD